MTTTETTPSYILPREKWWWLGLALLLVLAGWLYLRGYNVSLPYFDHVDEPHHLLAAQHEIDFGHARGVFHEAYPPGMRTLIYLLLKHIKPVDYHHGAVLPALRLITIATWMLSVVLIALLGAKLAHPHTGLMAAAIWIVNPWVVERAHWVLPDGYLTLFSLLALWLALIGGLHGRRSFCTTAVYCLMIAIVFKTTALFLAPIVLLLPLAGVSRRTLTRHEARRQLIWNGVRFAFFLFWLLLIYPTLESHNVYHFPVTEGRITLPRLDKMRDYLIPVLLTFQTITGWAITAAASVLAWRYRGRVNAIALMSVSLGAVLWLMAFGILPVRGDQLRQFFTLGAFLSLLYATSLTGVFYFLEEALTRLPPPPPQFSIFPPPATFAASLASHSAAWRQPAACLSRIGRAGAQLHLARPS